MIPVLTEAEFGVLTKVVVILFAVLVAANVFALQVSRFRRACRSDDLMAVADAVWDRIPRDAQ